LVSVPSSDDAVHFQGWLDQDELERLVLWLLELDELLELLELDELLLLDQLDEL
jgi:hypothetical protein